jgi:ribosome modulation factor
MKTAEDAFNEGFDAYLAGKGEERNPYAPEGDEHLSWNDGWLAAQAEEGGEE